MGINSNLYIFFRLAIFMEGLLRNLEENLRLKNYSREIAKSYLFVVGRYLEFSKGLGINPESAKKFALKRLLLSEPASVSHDVFALKYFFQEILYQKLNLPNPKRNKSLPEILTIDEIKKLFENILNVKHLLILKMLYGCGLRVSEIVNLRNADVNFEEELIHIKLAKGKKDRFVKLPSFLKNDLENGTDLQIIQKLFGHSDIKTTQIYTQISQASIKNIESPLDRI